ncbi:hypothetical protein PGN94_15235 [Klebsiella aerogenes]
MTNNQLTEAELTETLDAATSGYPLTACAEANLRRVFAELQERRKTAMGSEPVATLDVQSGRPDGNRFALASLEAEAVAYMIGGHYLMHAQDPKVNNYTSAVPLYTAPPTPVSVPDDVMAAIQKVARIRLDLNEFDGDKRGIAESLGEAEEALIEVVNRRAAMLQAEPVTTTNKLGNSPVIGIDPASGPDRTVEVLYVAPPGYVMVPKDPTAEMQSAGASAIRIETTALNKLWTGNAVFRAMLAAAPQGVK